MANKTLASLADSDSFKGHQLFKLSNNYVFDLTTFRGYIVSWNNKNSDTPDNIREIFSVYDEDGKYVFDMLSELPVAIVLKVNKIIEQYNNKVAVNN